LQFFDFRCWWLSSSSPEWVGITYAAHSSILRQIFCHKLMVASWRISEEKYPQKNSLPYRLPTSLFDIFSLKYSQQQCESSFKEQHCSVPRYDILKTLHPREIQTHDLPTWWRRRWPHGKHDKSNSFPKTFSIQNILTWLKFLLYVHTYKHFYIFLVSPDLMKFLHWEKITDTFPIFTFYISCKLCSSFD
jgi:hypothetical protein